MPAKVITLTQSAANAFAKVKVPLPTDGAVIDRTLWYIDQIDSAGGKAKFLANINQEEPADPFLNQGVLDFLSFVDNREATPVESRVILVHQNSFSPPQIARKPYVWLCFQTIGATNALTVQVIMYFRGIRDTAYPLGQGRTGANR